MIKKRLIFLSGLFSLSSCVFFEKEEPSRYRDKFSINSSVVKQASIALSKSECLPIDITKSGFCRVTDTSDAEIYLKPNTTLTELFVDSISPIASLKFCYAYVNKGYVIVKFHEANFSDKSPMISLNINNDSFNIHHSFWSDGKMLMESDTKYQELIINKKSYQVGDSISGYLNFRGIHKSKEKVGENFKGYFTCKIDSSTIAIDHVKNYKRCFIE